MARKTNPVYAYAKAYVNSSGYGHVEIRVHDLLECNHALMITCQAGGCETTRTYGWRYGLDAGISPVLETRALHEGYLSMRRLDRQMRKFAEELGSAQSFGEFAMRVLHAAGVPKVHVNQHLNAGYTGDISSLPTYHPKRNCDELRQVLQLMEERILSGSTAR